MTPAAWSAEVRRRIALAEGTRLAAYQDSLGVWTIGCGFNLERDDARHVLGSCGVLPPAQGAGWAGLRISPAQCDALLGVCLEPIVAAARSSLPAGVYDRLSDARRFVVCDLVYNLGAAGWREFTATRALIAQGQYDVAARHLAGSAWAGQVGARAVRDVAMMRTGQWVPA